jgi:hypothetical protein
LGEEDVVKREREREREREKERERESGARFDSGWDSRRRRERE